MTVLDFPIERASKVRRSNPAGDPAVIVILPVVRIEHYPSVPGEGRLSRRARLARKPKTKPHL